MNPFYNPIFLLKILKSYLFDIDRLRKFDENKLQKFQDKQIRKILTHAYATPVYCDKYHAGNVHQSFQLTKKLRR